MYFMHKKGGTNHTHSILQWNSFLLSSSESAPAFSFYDASPHVFRLLLRHCFLL